MGGCASVRQAPVILENTGTEFPTMCMLLQPDGTLTFRGGFGFYNPATWRRTENDGLVLTLGGREPFPVEVFQDLLSRHNGGLLGFDAKRREVSYRFAPSTEAIDFAGFYFYRVQACQAQ